MVNTSWGKKRVCLGCSVRYYDLNNPVPVCPKCGTVVELQPVFKSRKKTLGSTNISTHNTIENIEIIEEDLGEDIIVQEVLEDDEFDDSLADISAIEDEEDL